MFYFIALFILILFLILKVFPIISGYGAKTLCSNVFLCNREAADVLKHELSLFPVNLGRYAINYTEKSVTASVAGLAKKKAIFREGLGATLLNGISEKEFQLQTFDLPVKPIINQEILRWPLGNTTLAGKDFTVDEQQLNAALEEAFGKRESNRGTRAVVIVKNGELIKERYADGFTADTKLSGWSMAKSITNALIGILVKQNKLDIHTPVDLDEWKNDERKHITIAHLMQMSSGLNWWEFYAAPSDATNMLYNQKNMGSFAAKKKARYNVGKRFNYSSGSTNILSDIIRKTIGDSDYYKFPYNELFYKIGMMNTIFEIDAGGTFVGSSYCFATARDWARFGLLFLNDGIWNGERILPEGWVDFTVTPTAAKMKKKGDSYGAQWWLNKSVHNTPIRYPNVPADCFMCQGFEGQNIWIIPSENLVVVRLAFEKGDELNPDTFLTSVIQSFT